MAGCASKLYKGNVIVVGRDSKTDSLFDPTIATFEDDARRLQPEGCGRFHHPLNALRMRIAANARHAGWIEPALKRHRWPRMRAADSDIPDRGLRRCLHPLHAFIIGEIALEVESGQTASSCFFFVLAFGMVGFIAKSVIQNELAESDVQYDNVSVVKKANVYFDGKCVSHTVVLADGTKRRLASSCRPA